MKKETKFVLAIAVQLAVIFGIIVFKLSVLANGADVLLKIEPIDPRDPLRGDYVTFRYAISNLDSSLFDNTDVHSGDTIYVSLRQGAKYWSAYTASKVKPNDSTGTIFIQGKVSDWATPFQVMLPRANRIAIVYGVEEYFIPEGKGRDFSFWQKEVSAKVTVGKGGDAVLKQLYVDDKPWP